VAKSLHTGLCKKVYCVRGGYLYSSELVQDEIADMEERRGEGEWKEAKLVHRRRDVYTAVEVLEARANSSAKFRL